MHGRLLLIGAEDDVPVLWDAAKYICRMEKLPAAAFSFPLA